MKLQTLILICISLSIDPAEAAESGGAKTEVLVQASSSWDGAPFAYPDGTPELSVVRITIPKGVSLPWHCHPVPLAGAVTRGQLKVTKPDGASVTLQAGEGLVEVSRQWHSGHADEEVEIIVVYAGAKGQPLGFGQDADPELTAQCR